MTPQERIELTIRAAKVIRVLSELVDCRSKQVARMVMQEAAPEIQQLVVFVTAEGKSDAQNR
jgi:hypothetical protein